MANRGLSGQAAALPDGSPAVSVAPGSHGRTKPQQEGL